MDSATTNINGVSEERGVNDDTRFATFIICFVSILVCGSVSTIMPAYLQNVVHDLLGKGNDKYLHDKESVINAVCLYGWMFGGILWGIICDKIGRTRSVILSTAFYGLFTVLTGLASTWFWLSACRFLSGFGIGGVLLTTNILIAEIWPEKKRAIALGVLSISFAIGIFSTGLIQFVFPAWRQAFWIGIIPLVLAFILIWSKSESLQWIESRKLRNANKKEDAPVALPVKELLAGSVVFGTMLIGMWAIFSWFPTWMQGLPGNRISKTGLGMMLFGIGGLSGGVISGWVVNVLGLRKTMMMCFMTCFIFAFVLFKLNVSFNTMIYPEIATLAIFFGISQGALSLYIPQLFTTGVRALATGICFNVGRLFTATVVFFVGALVNFFGGYGNSIFAFSFVFLIGLITTFFSKDNSTKHL